VAVTLLGDRMSSTLSIITLLYGFLLVIDGVYGTGQLNSFLNLRQQDLSAIQCICSDVDGTLTCGPLHDCYVPDEVISSIKATIAAGVQFYPCTGRTRSSMNAVTKGKIADIFGGLSKTPGVYQQGLMVFGKDGKVHYIMTMFSIIDFIRARLIA